MHISPIFRRFESRQMGDVDSAHRLNRIAKSVGFKFYRRLHRHQKILEDETTTREIQICEVPMFKYPEGVKTPEKRAGTLPAPFSCPLLTDFIKIHKAGLFPEEFLHDVDVFTTLAALRSLICQWVDIRSSKSNYFKTKPHYCQLDNSHRLYLNTSTNYTVPFEKSSTFLARFAMLDHQQTWDEYKTTTYSGLAKIKLSNGIRVGFTYKVYSRAEDDEIVDTISRTAHHFAHEADYHFVNCFLTRKTIWRYERTRTRIQYEEQLTTSSIWDQIPIEKQEKLVEVFEHRLPDFLYCLAHRIARPELNVIENLTSSEFRVTPVFDGRNLW